MEYRILGKSNLRISQVGFGTWGLGGDAYGKSDDSLSIKTIHHAIDIGINFFDTSDLYGNGHSETVIGAALKGQRDNVLIASKGGMLPHKTFHMPQDFSVNHLSKALDDSLKRLQTSYIDLYQLHSPEMSLENWDEILDFLFKSKEKGKIRALGISARSPSNAKEAIEKFPFESIQINFNLIDQRAIDNKLFDLAETKNVGVIARTPLCFGYLTGKLTGEEKFDENDHRSKWPTSQRRVWAKSPELFKHISDKYKMTSTQLALKFCTCAHPAISTVIPGMMKPDHVTFNASIINLPTISDNDLVTIRDIYLSNSFFDPAAKTDRPSE